MKKFFAMLIAVVMLFALTVPAFADGDVRHFTVVVTEDSREFFEGEVKTNRTIAGLLNEKLFTLLGTGAQDKNGFETMTVELDYADRHLTAVSETVTAHSGLIYTTDDPETVFIVTPAKLRAAGDGETVITVTDTDGNQVDQYTVTSEDGVLSSACSKCGENQGNKPHLMVCGHFSCEDNPDHADCTEHIHEWRLCWDAAHWNNEQSYPFYRCSVCGEARNYYAVLVPAE